MNRRKLLQRRPNHILQSALEEPLEIDAKHRGRFDRLLQHMDDNLADLRSAGARTQ